MKACGCWCLIPRWCPGDGGNKAEPQAPCKVQEPGVRSLGDSVECCGLQDQRHLVGKQWPGGQGLPLELDSYHFSVFLSQGFLYYCCCHWELQPWTLPRWVCSASSINDRSWGAHSKVWVPSLKRGKWGEESYSEAKPQKRSSSGDANLFILPQIPSLLSPSSSDRSHPSPSPFSGPSWQMESSIPRGFWPVSIPQSSVVGGVLVIPPFDASAYHCYLDLHLHLGRFPVIPW